MLIRDALIIELAKECHKNYINDLDNKIRKESLRLTRVDLTKDNMDIINSRLVALKKAQESIQDITRFINLDEDAFVKFLGIFDRHSWSHVYITVDGKGMFKGYEFTDKEDKMTLIKKSIETTNIIECNDIDIEEIVNEVAKKISESLKAIKR